MIDKYRNSNKDLKEYKVKDVKVGTAKSGKQYTMCKISDCKKKEDGTFEYDNYTLFIWQENLGLEDGDKIALEDITSIEVVENEYNGKKYLKKTIFAEVKITAKANPNKVEVVGGNTDPMDNLDILPF